MASSELNAQLRKDVEFLSMVREFHKEGKKGPTGNRRWFELSNKLIRYLKRVYKLTSPQAITLMNDTRWSKKRGQPK